MPSVAEYKLVKKKCDWLEEKVKELLEEKEQRKKRQARANERRKHKK